MDLVNELKADMITAMKQKDKERLTVIRMVKAAMDQLRIDKKIEIDDNILIDVVSKQIKMRNDSIEEFKKANRTDLVTKTESEIEILKKYLPKQLNDDEVENLISEVITNLNATSMKDMGKVMQEVSPKVKGRYDMQKVSSIIKSKLS